MTTFLLNIPELLKVVQDWDDEVRPILPPHRFWFAPLSPETGKIDPSIVSIGEHRSTLARRNIKEWLESRGLPYHSPHKFRHGHVHYGQERSKTFADYKAVSQNVMHSSTKITEQTYSNLNDGEVQKRIARLASKDEPAQASELDRLLELVKQILEKK